MCRVEHEAKCWKRDLNSDQEIASSKKTISAHRQIDTVNVIQSGEPQTKTTFNVGILCNVSHLKTVTFNHNTALDDCIYPSDGTAERMIRNRFHHKAFYLLQHFSQSRQQICSKLGVQWVDHTALECQCCYSC